MKLILTMCDDLKGLQIPCNSWVPYGPLVELPRYVVKRVVNLKNKAKERADAKKKAARLLLRKEWEHLGSTCLGLQDLSRFFLPRILFAHFFPRDGADSEWRRPFGNAEALDGTANRRGTDQTLRHDPCVQPELKRIPNEFQTGGNEARLWVLVCGAEPSLPAIRGESRSCSWQMKLRMRHPKRIDHPAVHFNDLRNSIAGFAGGQRKMDAAPDSEMHYIVPHADWLVCSLSES
eukprot:Skav231558  [mRNA]  locus=scaffold481:95732:96922:- [translate_table: standard]